ncbi:MAG: phosphoglucomutase [Spirochaetaceae bacterium]|jgi:phosphomannomutase|nr:phosphoglucomutase [Spirochaetaceae bacterium]
MLIYDTLSHHPIADEMFDILDFPLPSKEALQNALSTMILSSSGWRKVFAESGDEEDQTPKISEADAMLAALAALALARFLGVPAADKQRIQRGEMKGEPQDTTILVGLDARPTGRVLGDIVCRTLTMLGCSVRYLYICAAPQIMADCNQYPEEADAFFYISASHNPIGHNGFKFGRSGGVYTARESETIIKLFKEIVLEEPLAPAYLQSLSSRMDTKRYRDVLTSVKSEQTRNLERYAQFVLTTAVQSEDQNEHKRFREMLVKAHSREPLGVLGELNGSARSVSIDYQFLTSLGLKVHQINDQPGQVVHAIVPEGENLQLCQQTLEMLYAKDPSFLLGYVPDNDGDRGNLVYIQKKTGKALILEAQNVFALVVLAELTLCRLKHPSSLLATVVNGPTSNRIDQIAQALDAEVFRCEVGEANVVELAEQKRKEGYLVPVLGEGSNGGNITHPAKVRDPLNTLLSLVKLLRNRDIAKLWFRANGREVPHPITLEKIIEGMPIYTTTGAFSKDGNMQIHHDHSVLKSRYEVLFQADWIEKQAMLRELDIYTYTVFQSEGTSTVEGMGEAFRSPPYTGGYKVALKNKDGIITDFLWMRGSKTEPVYRVMVDSRGDDVSRHDRLLAWHRSLIARADQD